MFTSQNLETYRNWCRRQKRLRPSRNTRSLTMRCNFEEQGRDEICFMVLVLHSLTTWKDYLQKRNKRKIVATLRRIDIRIRRGHDKGDTAWRIPFPVAWSHTEITEEWIEAHTTISKSLHYWVARYLPSTTTAARKDSLAIILNVYYQGGCHVGDVRCEN